MVRDEVQDVETGSVASIKAQCPIDSEVLAGGGYMRLHT